jgi:hypothetical protein
MSVPRQSLWQRLTTPMSHDDDRSKWAMNSDTGRAGQFGLGTLPEANHATTASQSQRKPRSRPGVLDRIFPPNKLYLNRFRRRTFLLFILLPLLIIFVLLPLILGLAIGLSRQSASSSSQPLPLPANDTSAIYTGALTYFAPALGSCGIVSNDSSAICAVSHLVYDAVATGSDPNQNPLSGKRIRIERAVAQGELASNGSEAQAGNRSVVVTVVDRCTGCASLDLDLSPGVFGLLANPTEGRVQGSWSWLADGEGS